MQMIPLRLQFEKMGRIKYISHLDTMRAFTRALGRSGLPLWYTEGFNPHLYLTFALPLALGCESTCESVDIRLTGEVDRETVIAAVNDGLPPGLRVTGVAEPLHKPGDIVWADYRIEFPQQAEDFVENLRAFATKDWILVMKRTKKGETETDIAPLSRLLQCEAAAGGVESTVRLASGIHQNINASLWLEALWNDLGCPEGLTRICRTAVLLEDFTPFC